MASLLQAVRNAGANNEFILRAWRNRTRDWLSRQVHSDRIICIRNDMPRKPQRSTSGRDAQGRSDVRGQKLAGTIAVVAGATRGAGRGIARALAEAGANVYWTGRSLRGNPSPYKRPETIEATAEMINAAGGSAVALRVDHTIEAE